MRPSPPPSFTWQLYESRIHHDRDWHSSVATSLVRALHWAWSGFRTRNASTFPKLVKSPFSPSFLSLESRFIYSSVSLTCVNLYVRLLAHDLGKQVVWTSTRSASFILIKVSSGSADSGKTTASSLQSLPIPVNWPVSLVPSDFQRQNATILAANITNILLLSAVITNCGAAATVYSFLLSTRLRQIWSVRTDLLPSTWLYRTREEVITGDLKMSAWRFSIPQTQVRHGWPHTLQLRWAALWWIQARLAMRRCGCWLGERGFRCLRRVGWFWGWSSNP